MKRDNGERCRAMMVTNTDCADGRSSVVSETTLSDVMDDSLLVRLYIYSNKRNIDLKLTM